jgi:creatinine amidohydrolase/Fe(II)-dependent formamide hydrolase-like protein
VPELDQSTKSAAKQIAREATAQVSDRHIRAQLRTQCYNRIVSLLDDVTRAHARHGSSVVRLALAAGAAGLALGSVSVWALLG